MNENYTREIDLINVIWKCLIQWKPALVVSLIFGLLVSGGMYAKNMSAYNAAVNSTNEEAVTAEELSAELTDEELEAVDNVATTAMNLKQRKEYVLNSALMHVDPYAEKLLTLTYIIETTDGKPVIAAIDSINTSLRSDDLREELVDVLDGVDDSKYIAELISSTYTAVDMASLGSLNIRVVLPNDTDADAVSHVFDSYITEKAQNLSSVASVTATQTSSDLSTVINTDLANSQKSQRDTITSLTTTLTSLESALADNQKQVYEAMMNEQEQKELEEQADDEDTDDAASAVASKPSFSAKYAVLGFVLGIFLYACLVLLMEIIKKNVDSATEISDCYGIRNLGEIHNKTFKPGMESFIYSQFVYNLRYKNQADKDSKLEAFAQNAKELADHKGLTTVKTVNVSADINAETAVTAEDATNKAGIVLVIDSGISKFKNVEKAIAKARDFEIPILGVYSVE